MNRTINSGYKVAEGFRDDKNPSDNWISGSYTIFYLFQNVFFNQSRMGLVHHHLLMTQVLWFKKVNWSRRIWNLYLIAFAHDAITYDDCPVYFNVSWKQRKRWSAGIIKCMKRYSLKLFKNFFQTGSIVSFDMALVYMVKSCHL